MKIAWKTKTSVEILDYLPLDASEESIQHLKILLEIVQQAEGLDKKERIQYILEHLAKAL